MKTHLLLLSINYNYLLVAIFCSLLLISLLLSLFSVEDDPYIYKGTFNVKTKDEEKFIDKSLLDEEIYGYRSLKTGRIFMIHEIIPKDEEIELITKKEVSSKGVKSLTNHIDSIINKK